MRNVLAKGNIACNVATVALVLFFCLPIFQSIAPIVRVAYVMVFFVLFFVTSPYSVILTLFFQSVLIFFFLSATYLVKEKIGTSYFQNIFISFWFWIPFLMMISLSRFHDFKFHKLLLNIVLLSLLLTSVTTIIGLHQFPFASRQLATGRNDLYPLKFYRLMNIGGYEFIYSLVLFLPILFGDFKFNIINRVLKLTSIIIFYICIIASQYTMAAILSVLLPLLVYIFFQKKKFSIIFSFVLVSILIIAVFAFFWDRILEYLISRNLHYLVNQLEGFYSTFRYKDSYLGFTDREDRYLISLFSFIKSPIFGGLINASYGNTGGHSSILDSLAILGMFGGVFIYNIYFIVKKFQFNFQYKGHWNNSIKIMWLGFIILSTINTVLSSFTLSIVVFVASLSYLKLARNLRRDKCYVKNIVG